MLLRGPLSLIIVNGSGTILIYLIIDIVFVIIIDISIAYKLRITHLLYNVKSVKSPKVGSWSYLKQHASQVTSSL